MPLFPDAPHNDVHVPLLDLVDVATGERAVSTGRGAAHELRLLFEGVTGIGVAARAGYGELIAWTVGELLEAFYRGGGKVRRSGERPGDWELIRRACRWISGAAIPWRVPSGNVQPWAIMTLRSLPGERPSLSDPVVFDVRLPPGAGPGPAVDRPALREAGRISSPAFRIGVAVPSATWIPGRTRRPVPGVGGLWIGDASRYPVFSARDRRRIAFGPESTHRPGGIDDAWHKSADAAGVVILDTEAVDRDGKARLDRRAGGGGQSDTQSDNVGGANRCIQGGQPLHPGGPTVASTRDSANKTGGATFRRPRPRQRRGGQDGRPSGKPARPPDLKTTPFPALNPSFLARRILHTPVVLRRGEDGATEA